MAKTFTVNDEKIEIWEGNRFLGRMAPSDVKEIQDDGENLIVILKMVPVNDGVKRIAF